MDAPEQLEERSFYGHLEDIISFVLPASRSLGMTADHHFVIAGIRTCSINTDSAELPVQVQYFSQLGALNFVNISTVQCVIGRVQIGRIWAIIDRTGSLQRAWYNEDDDE
jgi:hypothetical protein